MKLERGALRLGAEIEVPQWTGKRTFNKVATDLLDSGYMMGGTGAWSNGTHDYHCSCEKGGCRLVRKGVLIDPPIVSMTYDATLPKQGAEFIMSPILINEESMQKFRDIWNIVVDKAEWTTDLLDIKGRPCSPSVHVHVSATQEGSKTDWTVDTDPKGSHNFEEDALHAISLFSPEFFLVADTAGLRRGLTYRLPDRHSMLNLPKGLHHGFVQVRKALKSKQVYIEWRLFEAAYDNWNYIEQCAYMAAGLTRALLDEGIYQQLMRIGYEYPYDANALRQAVHEDDAGRVLMQVHPERLKALSDLITTQMDDDPYATYLVSELFDTAKAKVQQ